MASVPSWFGGRAPLRARLRAWRRHARNRRRRFPVDLLARSVSRDPHLLFRLPREQARRLAAAAVASAAGANAALLDAARRFAAADRLWTEEGTPPRATDIAAPAVAPPSLTELALEPGADPALALAAVDALGPAALGALPAPLLARLIDRAIRAAAASCRAATAAPEARPALRVLDALARDTASLPRHRPAHLTGAERAADAIRDWRDLSVCAVLLGPGRHPVWAASRDAEAFAAVWTVPGVFTLLGPLEAACLAGDAERAAAVVSRDGDAATGRAAGVVIGRCSRR